MQVWRICRRRFAVEAFSGEGARRFGGRWNSRGVPMVYASSSLALAAIELFVHLEPGQAPDDLVYVAATLPASEPTKHIAESELPVGWWSAKSARGLNRTRALGDMWAKSAGSLAMEVPSAALRAERNVLVNPLHPAIAKVKVEESHAFRFDARMFR